MTLAAHLVGMSFVGDTVDTAFLSRPGRTAALTKALEVRHCHLNHRPRQRINTAVHDASQRTRASRSKSHWPRIIAATPAHIYGFLQNPIYGSNRSRSLDRSASNFPHSSLHT